MQLFKQAKLDVVILEVGLGGRLDATNIVDSDVAAITSIALDHTDWLGYDRESIGREKAGVFRGGKPAVVGEPDMPQSIADVAAELGAQLYRRDVAWKFSQQEPFDQQEPVDQQINGWHWQCGERQLTGLPVPNVPLANAATALAVLHYSELPLSDEAIRQGYRPPVYQGVFRSSVSNRC